MLTEIFNVVQSITLNVVCSQKPCPKFINISEDSYQLSLIKEVTILNKTNVFKVC